MCQNIKQTTCTFLDRTGAPSLCGSLDMHCIFFILNDTHNKTIKNAPLQASTESSCNISPLLRLAFWKPVHFSHDDPAFGSCSPEEQCRFVGISENSVHAMTPKALKECSQKIIFRSNARTCNIPILLPFLKLSNLNERCLKMMAPFAPLLLPLLKTSDITIYFLCLSPTILT